ncbi:MULTISPECIES: hypothetical protein [unclassified Frankia]|uniref:hypothetical protein n=1 Tax=unclassified Frankia TaxID=2632575 RepID=UPI001EE4A084|nr:MULTISPECIES: hypothetical protein [unclassified Frankia]
MPHRQASQCAQEAIPNPDQPARRSNAASTCNIRQVAAAIRPAHPQSSSSSSGSGAVSTFIAGPLLPEQLSVSVPAVISDIPTTQVMEWIN